MVDRSRRRNHARRVSVAPSDVASRSMPRHHGAALRRKLFRHMRMNRTIRGFVTALGIVTVTLSRGAAGSAVGPTDGAGLPATDLERVKPGVQAPDFTLEDQNGRSVTLSAFRAQRPVVLVFYRGHW